MHQSNDALYKLQNPWNKKDLNNERLINKLIATE